MISIRDVFGVDKAVLGMVHLAPLPAAPRYEGSIDYVMDLARRDAGILVSAGVDAIIIENFNDDPFFAVTAAPETTAAMTLAGSAVQSVTNLPLGVNILRNSWQAAMAVAAILGARFIRINVLTDAVVTDQGIVQGCSADLLRYRRVLGAQGVLIFADIEVKHAAPIAPRPLTVVARDMLERGGADGLIVSGATSADAPDRDRLAQIRDSVPSYPLILGSGMTTSAVPMLAAADAAILGYGAKPHLRAPVDRDMVMRFMDAVRELRRASTLLGER